jgi:hypothetical protein
MIKSDGLAHRPQASDVQARGLENQRWSTRGQLWVGGRTSPRQTDLLCRCDEHFRRDADFPS